MGIREQYLEQYWESESKIMKGYLNTFTACEVILVSYPILILMSVVLCSCLLFLKFGEASGGHLGVLDGEDLDTQYLLTASSGEVIKEEMDTLEEVEVETKQGETQEISLEEN